MTRMELAARLCKEARRTNERRMLVLAGEPSATRTRAEDAIDAAAIDPAGTTYLGPDNSLPFESLEYGDSDRLLGTTRDAVVLDCHERCEPNTIARVAGAVDGGGLLILLTPPLDEWPRREDDFDASLAVPPFEPAEVGDHFRTHFVETVRAHRGIAVLNVDTDTGHAEGLTHSGTREHRDAIEHPPDTEFPAAAYAACRTKDQVDALQSFECLRDPGEAVVVQANRGRGKSSVAGIAAASLARSGLDVAVTAPAYRNAREVFARAGELAEQWTGTRDSPAEPREIAFDDGRVRFIHSDDIADLETSPDRLIVDEAAALPVRRLRSCLAVPSVAFSTTIHGYEGAGMGFTVRFREHLEASDFEKTDVELAKPIRYAAGDPIEVWSFRALALDARPPVDPLVADATPESVTYRQLSSEELLGDEQLMREVFGLLVLAHYRTEPNDLARLLDAPNVTVHALLEGGHPVSVALLAREGGLPEETRRRIYTGDRIKGNLIPDLLTSQLRDEAAAQPEGQRILRIATHGSIRSRGLGSTLVGHLREFCSQDWLGVGYGGTPELVRFWRRNGFRPVHVGTSRSDRSGEHSVVMLEAHSDAGSKLLDRHTDWFLDRFPATLTDALSHLDPDVVRAVCRASAGPPPLALSPFEWRIAAGIPHGMAIVGTAPRPIRVLTLHHLVAGTAGVLEEKSEALLDAESERLLVAKALQARSWDAVTAVSLYETIVECKRAFGEAVEALVREYGDSDALAELDRLA